MVLDNKLDINILWISKCTYPAGCRYNKHTHQFFHYTYIINGSAIITIGDKQYEAHEDELYAVPIGEEHGYTIDDKNELNTIEVKFLIKNGDFYNRIMKLNRKVEFHDTRVRHLLESMISEGLIKLIYYNEIISLKFIEILMYLLRESDAEEKSYIRKMGYDIIPEYIKDTTNIGGHDMGKVLSYMEENMHKQICLNDIANVSDTGKYHFNRKFKYAYGMAPIQYLNHLRIRKAKELMRYTDKNITEIAYSVGFSDVHYFSRYFKQKENMSPNEYLKKTRNNIYIHINENKIE